MLSNSAGDASPSSPAAGNNSDRSPDDDSRVGSGGPAPVPATVTGELLKGGDPADALSATDGPNGKYLLFVYPIFQSYSLTSNRHSLGDNPQESGTVRPKAPWAYDEDGEF